MNSSFVVLFEILLVSLAILCEGFNISENGGSIEKTNEIKENKICNTEGCRQVTNAFVESMNKSVDPCDDFYEFVCGNWESKNPPPNYEPTWHSLHRFTFLAETRLRDELNTQLSSGDNLTIRYVKQLYKSCMDNEARESEGLQKISAILREAKGWPMIMNNDAWNSEVITWQEIDHYYENLIGVHAFFTADTPDNPSGPILLEFERSEVPLRRKTYKFDRNYTSDGIIVYRSVIKNIARLFINQNEENVPDKKLDKDIEDLLKFEERLYKAKSPSPVVMITWKINPFIKLWNRRMRSSTSSKKIDDPSKDLDWKMILENFYNITKLPMNHKTLFSFNDFDYFLRLAEILDSTDKRTIVNYIHWNFLSKTLSYTTEQVNDILFKLPENEFGIQERLPRWLKCVREIEEKHAAAHIFARKYYPNKSNAVVDEMLKNFKKSFQSQINNSNWLSVEAKEAAVKKVDSLLLLSGYPKWYNNETALIKYYENLTIGTSYFENILKSMKHEWLQRINRWGKRTEKQIWTRNILRANGYNYPSYNIINIPAASLQSPLFDESLPDYIKYGTVGNLIGHEIGHDFDTTGIHFGGLNGRLFADDVFRMYREHVRCFVETFDNYFENDTESSISKNNRSKSSRGRLTVNENLADWSGVQAAFDAYKEIKDKVPSRELKLSGLEEFTNEQMFFVSFAHTWCGAKESKIYTKNIAMRDPHSPGKIRVTGTLSNTLAFAEAFNCPENRPMNPAKKCNFWTNSSGAPS